MYARGETGLIRIQKREAYKVIQLTEGRVALVNVECYYQLSKYKWEYMPTGYAGRYETKNGKTRCILMHREIMNAAKGVIINHDNGDKLYNLKENLKAETHRESGRESNPRQVERKSKYKGIKVDKRRDTVSIRIVSNRKEKYLGRVPLGFEEIGARIYNHWARKLHGESAKLNDVDERRYLIIPKDPTSSRRLKSSRYTGVFRGKGNPKWRACIIVNKEKIYLGSSFKTEHDAASAWNDAAIFYFGDTAILNKIQ